MLPTCRRHLAALAFLSFIVVSPAVASAQAAPDGTPIVAPPKVADAPGANKLTDSTNITLSAGGQWVTGNSNSLAGTVNGTFEMRRGDNGFGAGLLGNYAQGAPPGASQVETTENLQGKLRYDRYFGELQSVFLLTTGRHDRFQGLDFRWNVDPGYKRLFFNTPKTAFWGEAGYDFQYDIREDTALTPIDPTTNMTAMETCPGGPTLPGLPCLSKTGSDHSIRAFVGYRHAFNDSVTASTGLEYLQSFIHSTNYRLNFDARLAAALAGGFSVGIGVSVRYDHNPLPGKVNTDTATTLSLIYSFSDIPKPAVCPCNTVTPVPLAPPPPPLPPPPPRPCPPVGSEPTPPASPTWIVPPAPSAPPPAPAPAPRDVVPTP